MKVAIVGSGIAGITAAYYLAKDGHSVTVFEKERYPAMKTSFANGGQISVSNSEVWTTWKNVKKGIKWIFKKDAPLLIRPSVSYRKLSWLIKFLWHTYKNDYYKNTSETIRLGLESRLLIEQIAQEEKIDFDFNKCGILHFYKDKNYFLDAQTAKKIYNDNGCEWDILSTAEIKKIDPNIKSSEIIGGAWTPGDFTGDIHKFCSGLGKVLEEKYNVKFMFDYEIKSVNELDHFDKIIIANGVECFHLAKTAGDNLPVYPVKGYSITIYLDKESLKYAPAVSLLDDQAKIVTAMLGDRLRVAGTAEITDENWDIDRDRVKPLLEWVHVNFPKVNTEHYSSWACLRPMTPNMMPIVKRSKKNPKVYYHVGHGHLGWTLSAATAKQLSKIVNENN